MHAPVHYWFQETLTKCTCIRILIMLFNKEVIVCENSEKHSFETSVFMENLSVC